MSPVLLRINTGICMQRTPMNYLIYSILYFESPFANLWMRQWLCYWYTNSRAILTKLWTFGLSKNHVLTSFKISLRWHQFLLIINFLSVCMTCFVSIKKHFMCTYSVLMYIKNWMQFVKDCCNYYSNYFIIIFVSASLQLYLVTLHASLSQGPWSYINYSVFYTWTCTSNTLI